MTALQDIELRLQYAEEQLNALSADIRETMESDLPTAYRIERNVADESFSVFFKEIREVKREWGIDLGGFLHNVRSSLDHCVAALVTANGGTVDQRHQFPIVDSDDKWSEKVTPPPTNRRRNPRGQLDDVAPKHVALIKSYQPYNASTGYKTLATLRDFTNADKHRSLHGVAIQIHSDTAPTLVGSVTFPAAMSEVAFPAPRTRVDASTEIARFKMSNMMIVHIGPRGDVVLDTSQMNVQLNVTLGAAFFGEDANKTVGLKTFRDALADVRVIVHKLAAELS